jgi:hypothetical protein
VSAGEGGTAGGAEGGPSPGGTGGAGGNGLVARGPWILQQSSSSPERQPAFQPAISRHREVSDMP